MLSLSPDMASLSVGSNNFPTRVYKNSPGLVDWLASEMIAHGIKPEIEAFDLGHIVQATRMAQNGRLKGPLYVQFVMGVKNAMPSGAPIFDFYIETLKRLAPDAQWCAAGIGPAQMMINERSIAKGGHTRTGLEDNVRLDRDRLAPSNAALVKRAVALCEKYERPVATWQEAREILGLKTRERCAKVRLCRHPMMFATLNGITHHYFYRPGTGVPVVYPLAVKSLKVLPLLIRRR